MLIFLSAQVYACEIRDFVCEHRLFLSNGRLWGIRPYSEYMVAHRLSNAARGEGILEVEETPVPSSFVDVVMDVCEANNMGFVVVDVGLTSGGQWCIIETNPPFALSSYDLDIEVYVEYCCAAWASLIQHTEVMSSKDKMKSREREIMQAEADPTSLREKPEEELRVVAERGEAREYELAEAEQAERARLRASRVDSAEEEALLRDKAHIVLGTEAERGSPKPPPGRVSGMTFYTNAVFISGQVAPGDRVAIKAARIAGSKAWRALPVEERSLWEAKAAEHNATLRAK